MILHNLWSVFIILILIILIIFHILLITKNCANLSVIRYHLTARCELVTLQNFFNILFKIRYPIITVLVGIVSNSFWRRVTNQIIIFWFIVKYPDPSTFFIFVGLSLLVVHIKFSYCSRLFLLNIYLSEIGIEQIVDEVHPSIKGRRSKCVESLYKYIIIHISKLILDITLYNVSLDGY